MYPDNLIKMFEDEVADLTQQLIEDKEQIERLKREKAEWQGRYYHFAKMNDELNMQIDKLIDLGQHYYAKEAEARR